MVITKITEVQFMFDGFALNRFLIGNGNFKRIEVGSVYLFKSSCFQIWFQHVSKTIYTTCNFFQSFRSVIHRIHAGHYGQQNLCSANIGSCFFSANMLLTCLQSHPIAGIALCVLRNANNSSRHLSFEFIFSCEKSSMRATEAHRYSEALRTAYHYICAHFTGRFYQQQTH